MLQGGRARRGEQACPLSPREIRAERFDELHARRDLLAAQVEAGFLGGHRPTVARHRLVERPIRHRPTSPPARFLRGRLLWWALGVLIACAAGGIWWRARTRTPEYVTATVTRGSIQRSVSMTGALNPLVTVQVGSYVSGPVKTLGCDYNTEVVVGQVCATIDPVPFQLVVDQDRASPRSCP